jgi:hypothetical protein
MTPLRIVQAARNNAIWCDTVCRAHGIPGEFHDRVWLNRHPVPRFHSNAITLSDRRDAATQLAYVQALITSGLPGTWSVKDSFYALDLARLGFQRLFEATWLWRASSPMALHPASAGTRWAWVNRASELARWETVWSGDAGNISASPQPRLFMPALLADQDVGFIAAYQDEKIVAVAIANRTDEVVGLSNVFVPSADSTWFWAGCIAMVQERFPGLPLVGYQRGSKLAVAQTLGFEAVQNLRVWIRQV